MSTDRDTTRIVRSWLEEGVTTLPDRVLDAVLDQVPTTPQRRAWWPAWRFPSMTNTTRLAAGAGLVVLAVAVIGFTLLSGGGSVGGLHPSPTPSPQPSTSPSPAPTLAVADGPQGLAAGTYTAGTPFPIGVTFTVPLGWEGNIGGPNFIELGVASSSATVNFSLLPSLATDPCHFDKGPLKPQPGPSVAAFATALTKMPGVNATVPTAVTLGGYQGLTLSLSAPASFAGCSMSPDGYEIWQLPLGETNVLTNGEADTVWILDVGGQRLVIDATSAPGDTVDERAEVQAVLASIRLTTVPDANGSPAAPASGQPAAVQHYAGDIVSFDYPAAWHLATGVINPSGDFAIAFVGPEDLPSDCAPAASGGGVCGPWPVMHLDPGGVAIAWRFVGLPGNAPPTSGTPIRVGAQPGLEVMGSADAGCAVIGGDESISVSVPTTPAGNHWIGVDACLAGPDHQVGEAAFAAMLASAQIH